MMYNPNIDRDIIIVLSIRTEILRESAKTYTSLNRVEAPATIWGDVDRHDLDLVLLQNTEDRS